MKDSSYCRLPIRLLRHLSVQALAICWLISAPFYFETVSGSVQFRSQQASAQKLCAKQFLIRSENRPHTAFNLISGQNPSLGVISHVIPDSALAVEPPGTQYSDKPTAKTLEPILAQDGRELIPVVKTGEHWFSRYKVEENDVQGDIRSPRLLLGAQLSYLLGYRMIDKNTLTIPRVKDLIGNIQELNNILIKEGAKPIGLTFYEVNNEIVNRFEFIKRFAEDQAYPIGRDQHVGLHDHSYHVPTIIIPNQLLEVSTRIVKFYLRFYNHMNREAGLTESEIKILQPVLDEMTEAIGRSVDYGMGNLTPVLLHIFANKHESKNLRELLFNLNYLSLNALQSHLKGEVGRYRVLGNLVDIKGLSGEELSPQVKSELLRKYGEIINKFYDRHENKLPQPSDFMEAGEVLTSVENKLQILQRLAKSGISP